MSVLEKAPSSPRVVYFHGFASGPGSRKAQVFREAFEASGWPLEVPDLNPADFRDLTIGGMLELVEGIVDGQGGPLGLVGSSLGGYLSVLLASRRRDVRAVVLMAPAFDIAERWRSRLGTATLLAWERSGTIPVHHHSFDEERPLGFGFYEDALRQPSFPDLGGVPALVFHGNRDDVVPPHAVEEFARRNESAEVRLLDDDHSLLESTPFIVHESMRFLGRHLGLPFAGGKRGGG